ncbi:MAG: hypothetical protein F4W95_03575 [Chloroflexi bacterium]|nr:hypothetical protein [Chloroflexota bacterium]MYD47550.1 hypothetical protein [Chloroflexota bacterium]
MTVGSAIAVGGSVGAAVGSIASTVAPWSMTAGAPDEGEVHPSSSPPSIATMASVAIAIEIGEGTRLI